MKPHTDDAGVAWKPGFWKHVPWVAFCSIFCFVVCCVGLAVILLESDGKEVATWPYHSRTVPVSVLLSLVVSIANLCLTVVLSRGYENSWWLQALKGAELHRLHFDLDIQRRISAVFSWDLIIDKFTIAAVISLIVSILDGPLIQRASTTSARAFGPSFFNTNINVSNATFPANFSSFSGGGTQPQVLTPLFSNVSRAYSNRDDIVLPTDECKTNTTCVFTLPAPGFDISCTQKFVPYDLYDLSASGSGNQISDPSSSRAGNNQATTFNVTITYDAFSTNAINTTVLYKPDAARQGRMIQRECVLLLATVGYPVTVSNGIVTLKDWQLGQNETIELTQISSDELWTGSVGAGGLETALGGVFYVLDALYTSYIALRVGVTTNGLLFNITGQAASNYLVSDISTYSNYTMTWEDPTTDIMNTARELMLRSAIAYSDYDRTAMVPQQLEIQRTEISTAYKSHYKYLAITLVCMVLQALVVSFLLLGWRHLGRDMSLDAFEIARALGAPLLQDASSNSNIEETLSPLRRVRLRYGEIALRAAGTRSNSHEGKDTIRHADEDAIPYEVVQLVEPGAGNDTNSHVGQRPRLGLGREEQVRDLRPGALYW